MNAFGITMIIIGMGSTVFVLSYAIVKRITNSDGDENIMWIYKKWPFAILCFLCFLGLLGTMLLLNEYSKMTASKEIYEPVTEQLYKIKEQ